MKNENDKLIVENSQLLKENKHHCKQQLALIERTKMLEAQNEKKS